MNDGKCGICGDAYDANPRLHEAPGGPWGNTGIVVGEYTPGQWIDVSIEVTTQHLGYFAFKVFQLHQHIMRARFLYKSAFVAKTLLDNSCVKNFRTKNVRVKY